MKQLIRYILLVVVCICTFLLSGCSFVWTMENGDPATPEDIKASVEKEFAVVHPNLVLQSSVVEQEKPFQRNVYVFYDESNGFSFTTNSVVQRPTLPVPGGERYTNANFAYSQEYLIHLNAALVERAKQHGLRMATHEEVLKLKKSEATRVAGTNKIPLFRSNEIIFVDKSVKGEDILTFMKFIYSEYKPQDNRALLHPRADRSVDIYYLPNGETDKSKALYLISFKIRGREDWRDTLMSGVGYQDKSSEQIERDIITVVDREIQQAVRRK